MVLGNGSGAKARAEGGGTLEGLSFAEWDDDAWGEPNNSSSQSAKEAASMTTSSTAASTKPPGLMQEKSATLRRHQSAGAATGQHSRIVVPARECDRSVSLPPTDAENTQFIPRWLDQYRPTGSHVLKGHPQGSRMNQSKAADATSATEKSSTSTPRRLPPPRRDSASSAKSLGLDVSNSESYNSDDGDASYTHQKRRTSHSSRRSSASSRRGSSHRSLSKAAAAARRVSLGTLDVSDSDSHSRRHSSSSRSSHYRSPSKKSSSGRRSSFASLSENHSQRERRRSERKSSDASERNRSSCHRRSPSKRDRRRPSSSLGHFETSDDEDNFSDYKQKRKPHSSSREGQRSQSKRTSKSSHMRSSSSRSIGGTFDVSDSESDYDGKSHRRRSGNLRESSSRRQRADSYASSNSDRRSDSRSRSKSSRRRKSKGSQKSRSCSLGELHIDDVSDLDDSFSIDGSQVEDVDRRGDMKIKRTSSNRSLTLMVESIKATADEPSAQGGRRKQLQRRRSGNLSVNLESASSLVTDRSSRRRGSSNRNLEKNSRECRKQTKEEVKTRYRSSSNRNLRSLDVLS